MKRLFTMFVSVMLVIFFFPTNALAATSPYYSNIKKSSITKDNAVITATINNPSKVKLTEGGFYINTSSGSAVKKGTKMTDKISGSWQTAKSIPCSYNFKNGYRITLKENTTYYVLLYCKDINGKIYYSEEISIATTKAQSSTAKPDNNPANLPPDAAPTNIGPFISNFDEIESYGNGGKFGGCFLNSMTMVLNALGKRSSSGYYLTPNDVTGNTTQVDCPPYPDIEKKFGVNITESYDFMADFETLSSSEQEARLIKLLKTLPQGQRALRVSFGYHCVAVILDSNDKLVVYDPGFRSKKQAEEIKRLENKSVYDGEGVSYSRTTNYWGNAKSFLLIELN